MPDKIVRTLSQPSNRAKVKDAKDKKVVFKGVLDNPFRILWPSIPVNLQNVVFGYLTQRLEGSSDYHFHRCVASIRKRKRALKVSEEPVKTRKAKIPPDNLEGFSNEHTGEISPPPSTAPQDSKVEMVEPPPLSRHITCGINEVTKKLELQTQNTRRTTIGTTSTSPPPLKYVFVCRADVNPALLIDHLPHLVATHNSNCLSHPIRLVTLPKGSELVLAHTLGIRRITVLAIDNAFEDQQLTTMLEQVPILAASWLAKPNVATSTSLIPTHIKHVRTTAPKDMKAAKELRIQQKADVKKKHILEKKNREVA